MISVLLLAVGVRYPFLTVISILDHLSTLIIIFLVFVHWRKGPEWWTKVSPKIFIGLTISIFFVIPLIIAVYLIFALLFYEHVRTAAVYCVFHLTLALFRPVEFYFNVWLSAWPEARFHFELKEIEARDGNDGVALKKLLAEGILANLHAKK